MLNINVMSLQSKYTVTGTELTTLHLMIIVITCEFMTQQSGEKGMGYSGVKTVEVKLLLSYQC